MARKHKHHDLTSERLLADLHSPEEAVRAKALHAVCPCEAGPELFEQHMDILTQMKKDPSPTVRDTALHVFKDALEGHGLPTSRAEVTNEMLRTRRQSRFILDEGEANATSSSSGRPGRRRTKREQGSGCKREL